ncbi:uncharacterized protein BDR25DRAFT_353072 [Lindgomyces ingoldianus]|uniref:Uncharacterized protein n=1 Tax=Lindgomyces ingoldianus TaxID=673940 RepID=A0ACB6R0C8_9PLEO|nr:uncharacterized protein BDR25DRAFT_353072 [Lindgomyces ingoldianus]KAF2472749.1 hypothetical protein BDR25DRAFT_353072 [Lindgomyces ingoldianus]
MSILLRILTAEFRALRLPHRPMSGHVIFVNLFGCRKPGVSISRTDRVTSLTKGIHNLSLSMTRPLGGFLRKINFRSIPSNDLCSRSVPSPLLLLCFTPNPTIKLPPQGNDPTIHPSPRRRNPALRKEIQTDTEVNKPLYKKIPKSTSTLIFNSLHSKTALASRNSTFRYAILLYYLESVLPYRHNHGSYQHFEYIYFLRGCFIFLNQADWILCYDYLVFRPFQCMHLGLVVATWEYVICTTNTCFGKAMNVWTIRPLSVYQCTSAIRKLFSTFGKALYLRVLDEDSTLSVNLRAVGQPLHSLTRPSELSRTSSPLWTNIIVEAIHLDARKTLKGGYAQLLSNNGTDLRVTDLDDRDAFMDVVVHPSEERLFELYFRCKIQRDKTYYVAFLGDGVYVRSLSYWINEVYFRKKADFKTIQRLLCCGAAFSLNVLSKLFTDSPDLLISIGKKALNYGALHAFRRSLELEQVRKILQPRLKLQEGDMKQVIARKTHMRAANMVEVTMAGDRTGASGMEAETEACTDILQGLTSLFGG